MTIKYRRPAQDFMSFIEKLDEYLGDPDLNYAYDTLSGIYDWCSKNGVVTEDQEQAVLNIIGTERWDDE